jgi:riboflavin-specific deaminase-like protein
MPTASRPTVTAVFAQSLDGRIALGATVREIARPQPRAVFSTHEGAVHAHRARAAHDAVLVGIGTVVADDPRLSVRLCPCPGAQPRRVVIDSGLAISNAARLIATGTTDGGGQVIVLGGSGRADPARRDALEALGVDACIVDSSPDGRVSLTAALDALAARGVRRVLVEGGSAILTAFFRADLVDAVEIDVAPVFVGSTGLSAVGDLGVTAVARALRLASVTIDRLGDNVLLRGRVVHKREGVEP